MRLVSRIALLLSLSVPSAFAGTSPSPEYREWVRDWVRSHSALLVPTSAPEANDQAANLVDSLDVTSLAEMDAKGLRKAELEQAPWSDSYWPTYAGGIAQRYADPDYFEILTWKENKTYLMKHLGLGKPEELSPAEKYDRLVGDLSYTLTKNNINAGEPYVDAHGDVERWFGICHGWAPAAMMLPRPRHSVTVRDASGKDITFRPSDIKALGSLLWANGAGETRFISGRCNIKDPPRDGTRERDGECRDTNAGTWHLAVVNQLGVGKRSFVIDATASAEVWNQPVRAYRYSYANVATGAEVDTLEAARVKLEDYQNDPFAKFRAPGTKFLVRVNMALSYVAETMPSRELADEPAKDSKITAYYHYDLELDENDKILGGEWADGSAHPDFLWVPVKDAKASSIGDEWLSSQNDAAKWAGGRETVPATWRRAAKFSAGSGQPLARVVEKLFELAQ